MICEKCGGEVNISAGRCIKCGSYIDEGFNSATILRGLDKVVEEYGIGREEEENENLPELLARGTYRRKKVQEPFMPERPVPQHVPNPTMGLDDYMKLLGEEQPAQPAEEEQEEPAKPETQQTSEEPAKAETEAEMQTEPQPETEPQSESLPTQEPQSNAIAAVKTKAAAAVSAVTARIDKLTAPVSKWVMDKYHKRFPELKRAQRNPLWERIAILAGCAAVLVLVIMVVSSIASSIAPGVRGEWLIRETNTGERLTWVFSGTNEVEVRTYVDGESHVYQTGKYKKQRKNDHNLLTITYEDGKVIRLYYEVNKKSGIFTNVDSNQTAEYIRVG
ncbi:MAG: hypothetical protein E7559_06450 [Ruminococcaceae bacterium]|nr:hypothetical protein [Oscillospiraceae bacterium]